MQRTFSKVFMIVILTLLPAALAYAGPVGAGDTLRISNDKVECSVVLDSTSLISDRLEIRPEWAKSFGTHPGPIVTDGNFAMEIMWTDWQAPGMVNNAENPVTLTKANFRVGAHSVRETEGGKKEAVIFLKGTDQPLTVRIVYELDSSAFYVRRTLSVLDSTASRHFLQKFWPTDALVVGDVQLVKAGGFGQPVAFRLGAGGGFFGIEYPAANNTQSLQPQWPQYNGISGVRIRCGHEIGEIIGKEWLQTEPVVEGITPNSFVKLWFFRYIDAIRVAPLRPYTLYNSWYDLRSPEYPKVPFENVMNQDNISRIIGLIRKNMIEKHGITLDAFVLDDGWDIYKSDWVLRKREFPRGLKPIADDLKKTSTSLGMWFGPIGGYSFRSQRVGWMKEHGYEVVGDQMCVAGKKYSALLKKRVADMVADNGVGYFKWDGIQFSCSEPDHGHPVGIYSRRAVMETVIDLSRAVRKMNPKMFLNITSGTWLSPWWVMTANQIWMQGEDYGYADVPSISPRDAAITYRDLSLYEDFRKNDFWMPIQNLMTHGIIKGTLEKLGGEEEPLDKFTNEVLLYLARGVSMWELYISPDILSEGEWNAMAQAIRWAKDRFPILSTTEMIGGDPKLRQTYGYVHFKEKKGILAARNPWIEPGTLKLELAPADGLDPRADSLVLEKVYPIQWIAPEFYHTGSVIDIPLDGYETAVYEIYPISEARRPLLAGVRFEVVEDSAFGYTVRSYDPFGQARLLNPHAVRSVRIDGREVFPPFPDPLYRPRMLRPLPQGYLSPIFSSTDSELSLTLSPDPSVTGTTLAILLTPDPPVGPRLGPQVHVRVDGREDTAKFTGAEGASRWYTLEISSDAHRVGARLIARAPEKEWSGFASVWLIHKLRLPSIMEYSFDLKRTSNEKPMPPHPWPAGETRENVKVGEAHMKVSAQ